MFMLSLWHMTLATAETVVMSFDHVLLFFGLCSPAVVSDWHYTSIGYGAGQYPISESTFGDSHTLAFIAVSLPNFHQF